MRLLNVTGLLSLAALARALTVYPSAEKEVLIGIYGLYDVTGAEGTAKFTGYGVSGECYEFNFPVYGFTRVDAAYGYECDVYEEKGCKGTRFTANTPLFGDGREAKKPVAAWKSWKCTYQYKTGLPSYP
jgi:hypothetical protein